MRISDWSSDVCSSDLQRREDGEIHPERPIGEVARPRDLTRERLGRRLGQRAKKAERAGIGDGGDQLRAGHPLHPTLRDRMRDAERVGEARPDHRAGPIMHRPLSIAIMSRPRSEEHTSELQSLMRISYAVFCLKKKINNTTDQEKH